MSFKIQKGKALDALNLTPLIDVVFLLLIFFLVATQFSQDDQQLPIQLPSAKNALPMTVQPEELVVSIGQDGTYMLRGQRLSLEQLEPLLAKSVLDNPVQQTVILRGDKRVEFQSIVSLIDLCNRLKVPSYRIIAQDEAIDSKDIPVGSQP
ncbi:MAG: biopolymer transporter ExbD [Planctomycetaceae bacterium]|jgi:biopolymer transport protein ExbD|nr:biopolymer transporter ExbD [Planctomycetaceae bacterium]